jgi:hypothetical protein
MLDSLDTLIAFVLIYLVASMLITIAVQMVSSALNLRGSNLAWGLAETFETIAPSLVEEAKDGAKELADGLLKDTMLSDRQFSVRLGKFGWDFTLKATAVRPEELFDLMRRIASGEKTVDPTVKTRVVTLLQKLGLNEAALSAGVVLVDPVARAQAQQAAAQVKNNLLASLSEAAAALPDGAEKAVVSLAIKKATTEAETLTQNATEQILRVADETQVLLAKAYQKFDNWFETGQERAQQWFVNHTKFITGILAVVFAFLLQLDAIEIYKTVSTNKTFRDKLVAQAGAIEAQATKLLADGNGTLTSALETWKEMLPPDLRDLVKDLKAEPTDTRGSLRQRAATAIGNAANKGQLLSAFDAKVDEKAKADLANGASDYRTLKTALDDTGFELYPSKNEGKRWSDDEWEKHWRKHVGGMLFSAGLLSFGAPFWFNLLKSMMNLRSTVAEKIDQQKKKEGDGDPGSTPVTVKR